MNIPSELVATLKVVKRIGEATAPRVHWIMDKHNKLGVTAFNNRLTALLNIGLVSRTKQGKTWIYTADQ